MEDRIRCGKATGLRNLPFSDFHANDAWLTLVLVAQTLVCWAQALLLDGDLKVAEPKTCATGVARRRPAGPPRPPGHPPL